MSVLTEVGVRASTLKSVFKNTTQSMYTATILYVHSLYPPPVGPLTV